MPSFYLFDGPNGAGKTTAALRFLRRYEKGKRNFRETYRPLAHVWTVLDNSGPKYRVVARGQGEKMAIFLSQIWEQIDV